MRKTFIMFDGYDLSAFACAECRTKKQPTCQDDRLIDFVYVKQYYLTGGWRSHSGKQLAKPSRF